MHIIVLYALIICICAIINFGICAIGALFIIFYKKLSAFCNVEKYSGLILYSDIPFAFIQTHARLYPWCADMCIYFKFHAIAALDMLLPSFRAFITVCIVILFHFSNSYNAWLSLFIVLWKKKYIYIFWKNIYIININKLS